MGLGGNFLTLKLIISNIDLDNYEPLIVSPAEGAALDYFRDIGIDCHVITPPGILSSYGGKILNSSLFSRLLSTKSLISYNFKLYNFINKNKIDLIYTNSVRAQMSIALAALVARVKTLMYIKGVLANPLIDRICYITSSKILFFCEQNRDDQYPILTLFYKKKISILPIGLDYNSILSVSNDDIINAKKELCISSDDINIGILAQLYPPKGQHFVIESLERIIFNHPNAKLYLIGDHVIDEYRSYKVELMELIEKCNLKENVFFTGWRKDALAIANSMDIIVHPSLAEGFGRAVLESMAIGKPVIASSVGGLREAIEHNINGYLIRPGDIEAIAKYLELLIDSKELRNLIGAKARETVKEKYLIEDKVIKLSIIFNEMNKKVLD